MHQAKAWPMVLLSWSMPRMTRFIERKWGGTRCRPSLSASFIRVSDGRQLGLEHVLVAHLVIRVVEEVIVAHALGPGELRIHHLGEERVLALQLRRNGVPGGELCLEYRARRADDVDLVLVDQVLQVARIVVHR